MKRILCVLLLLAGGVQAEDKRPNIVWLISEDNSVHYSKLYFESGAEMPSVAALADDGVIFNHAFSVAPVCSAARSMLATGCYGSRIGTQFHRRQKSVPLPEGVKPVYTMFREAGYYTSNKTKTDYNFTAKGMAGWHSKNNWRGRKEGQPFFHKQTFGSSHEGSLHRTGKGAVADDVFVQPRHPNTPLFRLTNKTYNRLINKVDQQIGQVVKQLEADGLLEDTFIFYFGDHGGVLPGSKGYAYQTGLHVPMVMRIPESFKHLVDLKPGTRVDGFVEFVDMGATAMHLAGITPPPGIDGKPFIGAGISAADFAKRDEAFGLADRFDEKYDLVRTLRKGKYSYMRSYQPFNFDGMMNEYRYKMAAYREWWDLYKKGELTAEAALFFETRAPEALYDLKADPYETRNLADDPKYAEVLKELREGLQARIKAMPDLSLYPESHLMQHAFENPVAFGQEHKQEIGELLDVADLMLLPYKDASAGIKAALASDNPWKRYWALTVCSVFKDQAAEFYDRAATLAADDKQDLVRARAAQFLAIAKGEDPRPVFMDILATNSNAGEVGIILNMVVMLRDGAPNIDFKITPQAVVAKGNDPVTRRVRYLSKRK